MKQAIGTCTWPVALAARRGTWTADAGPASHEAVAHRKTPDASTNSEVPCDVLAHASGCRRALRSSSLDMRLPVSESR